MLNIIALAVAITIGQPEPERELRNYAAELNAPILAIPVEERAWMVYKRAILALEPAPDWFETGVESVLAGPLTLEQIEEATAYLNRNQEAIDLIREAASMPALGFILQNAREEEFEIAMAEKEGREPILSTPDVNPMMLGLLLTYATELKKLSEVLLFDCRIAAQAEDSPRLEADLIALARLSNHMREHPFVIGELAAQARLFYTCREIGWALAHHAGLLSDDQVRSIAGALNSSWPEPRIPSHIETEEWMFESILDHCFDRNGQITAEGVAIITSLVGGEYKTAQEYEKSLPIFRMLYGSEEDARQKFNECLGYLREYMAQPLWMRDDPTGDDRTEEAIEGNANQHLLVGILLVAGDGASHSRELAIQLRDATLAVIALELYRREHGAFPESLDELVPAFLEEVPLDRFDGKPLKYHLTPEGPVLYSVGTDRDDDGGNAPEFGNALEWFTPTQIEAARRGDPEAPTIPDGDWILFPPTG